MRETAKHSILKQTNKGLTCIMKDYTNISSGVTNSAALIALVFKDFRISQNKKSCTSSSTQSPRQLRK